VRNEGIVQLASSHPRSRPSTLDRLQERIRKEVRTRPGLETAILRVSGAVQRLDGDENRIFFLCYHQVPRRDLAAFRSGLEALTAIGRFLSWDEALSLISGERPVVGSHFCLTFDDGDRSWAEVVLPTLTDMSIPAAFFVVTSLVADPRRADALSWSSCQQLADQRMTVGSHTVTHRALADLDERAARSEMRDSKRELEERLGIQVVDFCAPYGRPGLSYLPERDVVIAKEEGYRSFATTVRGAMRHGDSPYQIRRLTMNPAWPALAVLGRLHSSSPAASGWS
jgi:peptidoglycan/xylan/chitin deacetylase (PgdA/CDA1 family)